MGGLGEVDAGAVGATGEGAAGTATTEDGPALGPGGAEQAVTTGAACARGTVVGGVG